MSRVEAAAADRLPWLADEPAPKRTSQRRGIFLPWIIAAMLLIGAGGFWLAFRSVQTTAPQRRQHVTSSMTVHLPAPRSAETQLVRLPAQPQVQPAPEPQVRPSPVREVHIAPPHVTKPLAVQASAEAAPEPGRPAPEAAPAAKPQPASVLPRPWDPRMFEGASGRIVQIGAFGSTHQAKRGWWYMVRAYPAVAHLPAVVRTSRNSTGRTFYRFQVGTTSQAHSEILCQRMERIRLSCAVVGLPWKAKVER